MIGGSREVGNLRTYHTGPQIQTPAQRIHRNDMRALLIPRTVLAPVRRRDFVPGVVEFVRRRVDLHFTLCVRSVWSAVFGVWSVEYRASVIEVLLSRGK